MINKIQSDVNFCRKQDIASVKQAREALSNLYAKYVKNGLLQADDFGDVLILDRVGIQPDDAMLKKHGELKLNPSLFKKRQDLASDEKIKSMELHDVQKLLRDAQDMLKQKFKLTYDLFMSDKKKLHSLKPAQKEMLYKMVYYSKTPDLVSIPKR